MLVTVWLFCRYSAREVGLDFHRDFRVAGARIRHGLSPYVWSRRQIAGGESFPYPATVGLLFVILSFIPRGVSDLISAALTPAGCCHVLNVRDWRLCAARPPHAPVTFPAGSNWPAFISSRQKRRCKYVAAQWLVRHAVPAARVYLRD